MSRLVAVASVLAGLATSASCDVEMGGDGPGGEITGEYEPVATMDFSVPPGEERYYCLRKYITEDMYIAGFESISPPGVHHMIASAGEPDGPDDVRECTSYDHHFEKFLYEGSSGVDPLELPQGLAARIEPGQQLNLNIHILNTTDQTQTGTAGVRILRETPVPEEDVAASVYMGRLELDIPPGVSTHIGQCELTQDETLFAITPHMHSHGIHMKVTARSSIDGDVVVHDEDFFFDTTKKPSMFDPVKMKKGDIVSVECTYDNNTGHMLHWGEDSFTAEMCFAAIYLYPGKGILTACGR